MINIKHTGIYVKDIEKQSRFYKECFSMNVICEDYQDEGPLFDELLGYCNAKVLITKLITEMGKETGTGDMIELIQVLTDDGILEKFDRKICDFGMSHVAVGVSDIEKTRYRVLNNGGSIITNIHSIGNKKCCFCKDPEGNGIELIQ